MGLVCYETSAKHILRTHEQTRVLSQETGCIVKVELCATLHIIISPPLSLNTLEEGHG